VLSPALTRGKCQKKLESNPPLETRGRHAGPDICAVFQHPVPAPRARARCPSFGDDQQLAGAPTSITFSGTATMVALLILAESPRAVWESLIYEGH
jgi:hypothetical protein